MIDPHSFGGATKPQPVANGEVASPDDPDAPHQPGIYLYAVSGTGHTLTELQRVNPKQSKGSGGLFSSMTYGIAKIKTRAVIEGANAPVKSSDPNPVVYLYVPESAGSFGGSYIKPNDFTLPKLTQKNNTREIIESSSNIWSSTAGTDDKAKRVFTVDQIRTGAYKLTLAEPLLPGEYAFVQGNYTFYDFRILPPE